MTARLGDEIMVISPGVREPVREGRIRGIRHELDGVVYVVEWSDTGSVSLLPHGPDVVIKRRRRATAGEDTSWLSRLRYSLRCRHAEDTEPRCPVAYGWLAQRVEEIFAGLGLIHSGASIGAGVIFCLPQVVSVDPGPPVGVHVRILPGQSPENFSAHAAAIAYDLGMAEVRVVPLGPSDIRLELLSQDGSPGSRLPAGNG